MKPHTPKQNAAPESIHNKSVMSGPSSDASQSGTPAVDGYDAADDSRKSYDVAIDAMREKLLSFRREQIGDATLWLGDCREILPLLPKVDAVVTDPPYGVGFTGQTENDGRRSRGGYASFSDDDPEYILERVRLALDCAERAAITPGTRLLSSYPPFDDLGCFFVPGGVGMGRWGFCCSHPIAYYGKRPKRPGMWPTSFYDAKPMPSDMGHPVAKPIEWMERLVSIASLTSETILDPFMGSGTTGVACAKLGRKFIGIEIEPKYFDIACKRIDEAYRQPRLFKDEAPKAKQEALL